MEVAAASTVSAGCATEEGEDAINLVVLRGLMAAAAVEGQKMPKWEAADAQRETADRRWKETGVDANAVF